MSLGKSRFGEIVFRGMVLLLLPSLGLFSTSINAESRSGGLFMTIMLVCPTIENVVPSKTDFVDRLRKEYPGEILGYNRVCRMWEGLEIKAHIQMYNPEMNITTYHLTGRERWLSCHKLTIRNLTEKKTVVVERLSSYSELSISKGEGKRIPATKHFKYGQVIISDPPVDLVKLAGGFKPGHLYKLELEAEPCFYKGIKPKPSHRANTFEYLVVLRPKNAREEGVKLTHQAVRLIGENPAKAEELYREALRKDSSLLGPRFGLAVIYENQGKLRESLEIYKALLPDVEGRDRDEVEDQIRSLRKKLDVGE